MNVCKDTVDGIVSGYGAVGAEQAGDSRLPGVYFSKSLDASLAAIHSCLGLTQAATPDLTPKQLEPVHCLLPEAATDWDAITSSLSSAVALNGGQQASHGCVSTGSGQAVGNDGFIVRKRCHGYAVKLLAHPVGGKLVHQAVWDHTAKHCDGRTAIAKGLADEPTRSTPCVLLTSGQGVPGTRGLCAERHTLTDPSCALCEGWLDVPSTRLTASDEPSVRIDGNLDRTSDRPVVVLAVGPEGGWVQSELDFFTNQYAFQTVTTARSRILDTTTALISLVGLALDAMEVQQE